MGCRDLYRLLPHNYVFFWKSDPGNCEVDFAGLEASEQQTGVLRPERNIRSRRFGSAQTVLLGRGARNTTQRGSIICNRAKPDDSSGVVKVTNAT
jgi:hypothetical protein